MPSSGWSPVELGGPGASRVGQPGVGRIRLAERTVAIDRQPGVQRAVARLGGVEGGRRELARELSSPARRRAASSWAWSRVESVIGLAARSRSGRAGRPSLAADDRRDDDEPVALLGGVREGRLDRQRRGHDIVAEDVLELDRLGGRRDRVGVELGQLGVLVEDVVELALEPVSSSSVSPSRARWATCSTSSRVRAAMAR